MNGNCHFVFGGACVAMLALNMDMDATQTTLMITGGLLGSIFPDIDNPNSHFGKLTVPVSTAIHAIAKQFGKTKERHRWIFHDIGFCIAGLVLCLMSFQPLMGFCIGYLSHLILDGFNPSGISFFLVKRLHFGRIPSDSKTAVVVSWVATAIVLIGGIVLHILYPNGFAYLLDKIHIFA